MDNRRDTNIFTKTEFIRMLNESIDDDVVVVWTQNTGIIKYHKKSKQKIAEFGFNSNAFDLKNGVNDLIQKGTILFSAYVCRKEFLSQKVQQFPNLNT